MLAINTLNLLQAVEHGFPPKPSAIAHDPELNLLAIGTSNGLLKMYPLVVNKLNKSQIFDQNDGLTPLEKF